MVYIKLKWIIMLHISKGEKNESILLQGSYTNCVVVHYHFKEDCGKLNMYCVNPKAIIKIVKKGIIDKKPTKGIK